MKVQIFCVLMFIPLISSAQGYPGMNEADMQKLQEMEKCMQKVDKQKLNALETKTKQFEAEMKSLCAKGKRSEAQSRAMKFAKQMQADPTLKTMVECSKIMQGMMPVPDYLVEEKDSQSVHVCDDLK